VDCDARNKAPSRVVSWNLSWRDKTMNIESAQDPPRNELCSCFSSGSSATQKLPSWRKISVSLIESGFECDGPFATDTRVTTARVMTKKAAQTLGGLCSLNSERFKVSLRHPEQNVALKRILGCLHVDRARGGS
jgi:hypothetical protein